MNNDHYNIIVIMIIMLHLKIIILIVIDYHYDNDNDYLSCWFVELVCHFVQDINANDAHN